MTFLTEAAKNVGPKLLELSIFLVHSKISFLIDLLQKPMYRVSESSSILVNTSEPTTQPDRTLQILLYFPVGPPTAPSYAP